VSDKTIQLGELVDPQTGETVHFPLGAAQDEDQAAWLAADFQHRVRYNHATKAWHIWHEESRSWRVDKVKGVERGVVDMAACRAQVLAGASGNDSALKFVRKLLDAHKVRSALDLLSSMPDYNTDGTDWDEDPFLLGCANGVVDLRTGEFAAELTAGNSTVTKNTNVPFNPAAQCPKFIQHLYQISSEDMDLARWYVQWWGYCLFGINYEQKFLVLTGEGRNGKGAMVKAVRAAIGEYDAAANSGIYMKSRFGSARSSEARSDLITLKGARIAVMSEPEGGQFNEELLKAHTGGDPIVARPLYGKEMTWEPTHTPSFLVNRPPSVDDIGPAMAERILVADFREQYLDQDEKHRRNPQLYEELTAEKEGILALLIVAAREYWTRHVAGEGMWYPERVQKASQAYITANDPVGQALQECFVIESGARTQASEMYRTFSAWYRESDFPGELPGPQGFSALLMRRGFARRKNNVGSYYVGVRPKNAMELAVVEP
jgi:putative DNA primase/helicase